MNYLNKKKLRKTEIFTNLSSVVLSADAKDSMSSFLCQ